MAKSKLEDKLVRILADADVPTYQREHRFHPTRRWRFDFAWPDYKLAVEVEGGAWTGGRHTRGSGFVADCDKYNAATVLGWRVLRYTTSHLRDEQAVVEQIQAILKLVPPNA